MKMLLSYLPPSARELISIIGLPDALRLIDRRGGTTLIPAVGHNAAGRASLAALAEDIGEAAARKLAEHYRGTELSIPCCHRAMLAYRDEVIRQRYTQLTKRESGLGVREAANQLGREYHLTARRIFGIANSPSANDPTALDTESDTPHQPSLFA